MKALKSSSFDLTIVIVGVAAVLGISGGSPHDRVRPPEERDSAWHPHCVMRHPGGEDSSRRRLRPEPPSANTQLPFAIDDQIDPTLLTAHGGGAVGD